MGFLTRALVPRSVRRAAHPMRTAKSAATPRIAKQARNVLNPIDSAVYSAERAMNTKSRKTSRRARRKSGGLYVGAWIADRSRPDIRGRVLELRDDGSAVTIWDDGETRIVRAE